MSVLAFKAIDAGAERIPDKFFERIPGGFFTPAEKKNIKKERADRKNKKDKKRHDSEPRSDRRSSRRDRSPETDYSEYSAYDDTDYERERERRRSDRNRRAKSAGLASSRSLSRGRHDRRSEHVDGESSDPRNMAHAEQGAPYEYRPYNPQDYATGQQQGDYRPATADQSYGYQPPQVNNDFFRSRSATVPMMTGFSSPMYGPPTIRPSLSMSRPPSNLPTPLSPFPPLLPQSPMHHVLRQGTPVSAAFSPSSEPPLATLFSRPSTNSPKPATHSSSTASRYTPGPGYAPSPPVNSHIPTPPVGSGSPYVPYNPAEYASNGAAYPSPPPFNRQRSNSQPASPPYPTYVPPSADQRMTAYDSTTHPAHSPSRRSSTKPRREHRHRARSADTSRSSRQRSPSRMTKMRERFDDGFMRDGGGLAASLGGALVGGFAGNKVGRSKLTTIAGAAAGALGAKTLADRRSK